MTNLCDVEADDLEQELSRRGWILISPDDDPFKQFGDKELLEEVVDRGYVVVNEDDGVHIILDEARSLLFRGEIRECLYAIERELPHEFAGLTEGVFRAAVTKPEKPASPGIEKLPKRVQTIIDTVRHGQTLCLHKHQNREGQTEHQWFFEPSGKPATPKSAEAAVATSFLMPCGDGLFPNMAQTWRAAV